MRTTITHLVSLLITLSISLSAYALTISDIQGGGSTSPYAGMSGISTAGIVTAVVGNGYYIQDGAGPWNGIFVFSSANSPAIGDSISITGSVDEFYTLTEMKDITSYTLNSSGNPLPAAYVLFTDEVNDEAYEGVLVRVEDAPCINDAPGFGEFYLDDGSGFCIVDDAIYQYLATLGISYTVEGPVTFAFGEYKILPRNANDVTIALNLFFTRQPEEYDLTTSGFTLNWQTNINSSTIVEYGLTPALELGTMVDNTQEIEHQVALTGLSASSVYYVRPYSVSGPDTTPYKTMVISTVSNSSGDVNVYFNHSVDHSVATISEAVWTLSIIDTIISYIDQTQNTLDITMYEVEDTAIIEAINAAYDRGVQVRYITDDDANNGILDTLLNASIPVLKGNANGIMHDKFLIMDEADEQNCWVMTGSMNHTHNNLGFDYNNVICIQDQSLAHAYAIEFEEMWGSTGPMFDTTLALFSEDKTNNTPHKFMIDGSPVELYFSPSDGTNGKIKEVIDSAKNNIEFALLIFTQNNLGDAIVDADSRGLTVKGIIDIVDANGSEFDYLVAEGIDVTDYMNADSSMWPDGPQFHHKYMIADYPSFSETPVLITGSHNWTASAESRHDENTLIIYDEEIVNWYHQEFNARYLGMNDSVPMDTVPDTMNTGIQNLHSTPAQLAMYPNPAQNYVAMDLPESGELTIYSEEGKLIFTKRILAAGKLVVPVTKLAPGTYQVMLSGKTQRSAGTLIKH